MRVNAHFLPIPRFIRVVLYNVPSDVWVRAYPNIKWDIVVNNPNKPWDWCGLSKNQNITISIVKDNKDKPWDWYGLSANPNITWIK
jgi:hypothetical protein